MGRSPRDVEDQITYPLTSALLGVPGVRSVRSNSMFGFSAIYLIFEEDVEFYWSRSRILEKLASLPAGTLPEGVAPTLGPDATALGQIYWYTLEGRDPDGKPTGGWDLDELRSIQDFYVRYGLSTAPGVSEVASIGGYVREYQVDVDPERMRQYGVTLQMVMEAVRQSNLDVGAQTLEINRAEYFVRGLGYLDSTEDLERSVLRAPNNVPLTLGDVARVSLGPATRRGLLDKSGAEAVGGVVVARYGANPLSVIEGVKTKIAELQPGLPTKTLQDGTSSQVTIVPFYDRSELIGETIGTLEEALTLEVLITLIVVILMLLNFKSSLLVGGTLPVAVLMCFIAMRYFGVDANIVALSGIAIAIGTMVDVGIVLVESMLLRLRTDPSGTSVRDSILEATVEVGGAVLTAVATTVISFLPVFTMEAAEGKLFRPLAFTKTFALLASIVVALLILPVLAKQLFALGGGRNKQSVPVRRWLVFGGNILALIGAISLWVLGYPLLAGLLAVTAAGGFARQYLTYLEQGSDRTRPRGSVALRVLINLGYALVFIWLLASVWLPLGVNRSEWTNFVFVALIIGLLIGSFYGLIHFYETILRFLLRFKLLFLLVVGLIVWRGFVAFQQTGSEFMPALDEGSFLLMPTAMPHAGVAQNLENLRLLDMAVTAIPEVETVVGKAGRVNSPLDPAPLSMYENVILYKTEYATDAQGHRRRFRFTDGEYIRDATGELIPDPEGRYFRQWRDEIKSPDDIWDEIVRVTQLPGVTSAPRLQPIETRLVMLQTGMRAPMGVKVAGPDLATIEQFGLELERLLVDVPGVKASAVFADRIVGKPYLLIDLNREALARYGFSVERVQRHVQAAIGGMTMTYTVEGRERYAVRLRYPREMRNDPAALQRIYVSTDTGAQIPLGDLVDLRYEQGAQSIKSEDGFLIGYVLFDRTEGSSEVEVVERARDYLSERIEVGDLIVPAGVSYRFAGNYEQQQRAEQRLSLVLPIALALIFLILYFQFRSAAISLMVFSGVFVAFAGGFLMIGWYATDWFLNFSVFGVDLRDLFQVQPITLSVAVWVGFLALFGIATDDGVLVATFLRDSFRENEPQTIEEIRDATVAGGLRRVRPAMMTTATTLLALLPVLTSTGRGADIMIPMAIPSFGGMSFQIITMFTVPVLFALWRETRLRWRLRRGLPPKTLSVLLPFLFVGGLTAQTPAVPPLEVQDHPELRALDLDYRAARLRADQTGYLPDLELAAGVFPLPVETRLGAQTLRLGATQMFPWFGTLDARRDLASARAEVLSQSVAERRRELHYRARLAWLDWYELRARHGILARNLNFLTALEQLALARVEGNRGRAADVLRVQLRQRELQRRLTTLRSREAVPLATLAELLNEDVNTLPLPDSLPLPPPPAALDSLLVLAQRDDPTLNILRLRRTVSERTRELNALDARPNFGVGADYIFVQPRTDADPNANGRDIVQLRATLRLPLDRRRFAARDEEEQLLQSALDERSTDLERRYRADLSRALSRYATAREEIGLLREEGELLAATLRLLRTDYTAGRATMDEILLLRMELIALRIMELEQTVAAWRAWSEVARRIGI